MKYSSLIFEFHLVTDEKTQNVCKVLVKSMFVFKSLEEKLQWKEVKGEETPENTPKTLYSFPAKPFTKNSTVS